VDGLLAGVVHRGKASLWDLKNRYSLEDVKWLEEADYIPELNEYRHRERQRRHNELKGMAR